MSPTSNHTYWDAKSDSNGLCRMYLPAAITAEMQLPFENSAMRVITATSVEPLDKTEETDLASSGLVIEMPGLDRSQDLTVASAIAQSFHIAQGPCLSYVPIRSVGGSRPGYRWRDSPNLIPVCWASSSREQIGSRLLEFTEKNAATIFSLQIGERFDRVANGLRLFEAATHLVPSDVALVMFMTVLEGLFSDTIQELSLRLGLTVSRFLDDDNQEKFRETFDRCKLLYGLRSKIVHGAKIAATDEGAAIALADTWTPSAAALASDVLEKAFRLGITELISSNKNRLFFDALITGRTVNEAVEIASE